MIPKAHPNINCSVITITGTAESLFNLINTAGSITSAPAVYGDYADAIDVNFGDAVRVTWDGTTPTADLGDLLQAGRYSFRFRDLSKLKLIRVGGSDVSASVVLGASVEDDVESAAPSISGTSSVAIDHATDDILVYGNDGTTDRKVKTDSDGNLQVDVLSSAPISGISDLDLTYASIDASADVSDVTLIPATSGKKGYLYYINLQFSAAGDVGLKDGSTALMGVQTVVANQVYTESNLISSTPLVKTSSNSELKISRSASMAVKGYVAYLLV